MKPVSSCFSSDHYQGPESYIWATGLFSWGHSCDSWWLPVSPASALCAVCQKKMLVCCYCCSILNYLRLHNSSDLSLLSLFTLLFAEILLRRTLFCFGYIWMIVHVCTCRFTCMHTHVCVCTLCTTAEARGRHWVLFSITFDLIPWLHISLLNLELSW